LSRNAAGLEGVKGLMQHYNHELCHHADDVTQRGRPVRDQADEEAEEAVRRSRLDESTDVDTFKLSRAVDVDEWAAQSRMQSGARGTPAVNPNASSVLEGDMQDAVLGVAYKPGTDADANHSDQGIDRTTEVVTGSMAMSSRVAILLEPLSPTIVLRTAVIHRQTTDSTLGSVLSFSDRNLQRSHDCFAGLKPAYV
jgi:hypothetical protein